MKSFFLSLLLTASFALAAFAQSNTGTLVGTVSDPSGLVVGATVVITDEQTGKVRTIVTNDEGSFTLSQLDVGTYSVKITATGHKTKTYSAVKIDIGKTYTLVASVDVGDVSEVVTVAAGADIINANNGEISTTVTGRQIVELPLNGRNPLSLVLLQAGSSSNGAQSTNINGQRSSFTNITRDGVNVQDNFIRSNAVDFIPDRPSVDDTGEFTIVTQNAGAEAGYGASQIQLVTPRGTNTFTGAAYLYNRNSEFTANTFFNNFSGIKRPFLNRNQAGGKIGGPIWKNKAFFFFNYEAFRLRQSVTANRTILLPSARTGTFTYRDNSGVVRSANIFTLAAAAGIAGAPTGIDPTIASRIINKLPSVGNNPALGDQLNTTGLSLPITSNQDRDAYSSRFDFDVTERHSINAVINYKKEYLQRTDLLAQQGGTACCYDTTPVGFQDANTPFAVGAWRWAATNSFSNELRGGWQKSDPIFGNTVADPAYYIVAPLINNPETGFQAQGRRTQSWNLQDNAVWIRGNHALRFGGQYDSFKADPFGPGAFGASYLPVYTLGGGLVPVFTATNFNTAAGCVAATGVNCISSVATANSLLALLGGLVGGASQTFNATSQSGSLSAAPPARKLQFEHYSFYGTDQWRVTPTFTVNYGVRYELFTPIREPNGLALEPIINGDVRTAILDPNGGYQFVGGNAGGTNFFKMDKNNIAPVVSFAWSPNFSNSFLKKLMPENGQTVIRGGYRLSYVNDEFIRAADNALAGNAGLSTTLTSGSINGRLTSPFTFTAPAGVTFPRTYAQNNTIAANFGTVFAIDPDLEVPGSHEFSLGVQREIGFQTALEVRYVHSRTTNLVRGYDLNQLKISDAFLADFNRARNNIRLYGTGNVNCVVAVATPLCQPLSVLNSPALFTGSPVIGATQNPLQFTNTTTPIINGTPADLAFAYVSTFRIGNSVFLPNVNTGVVDLLTNGAKSYYNGLQVELRRRFANGFTYQANYTFQKQLTDAPGTGQTRFEPAIDNARINLEYGIGDQDTTHVFNLNTIYELPFGKGKRFGGNVGSWANRLIGGWQVTAITRISTGAPISIIDSRGTFNRAGRSGRQTATTNLTKEEVRKLIGVFRTPCGVFMIDPSVINIDLQACQSGSILPRTGSTAGQASLGFQPISGAAGSNLPQTFPGQVFFSNAPGAVGNMELNFLRGPMFFNIDASVIKNIPLSERLRMQIRGEAFNLTNRANFFSGQQLNIASTTFGRITSTFGQRIVQFVARIEF
ncbi:MAG: carboxypeptidase regulatory-like domain-containing protein [Pyrinomonadaceae bacterium]